MCGDLYYLVLLLGGRALTESVQSGETGTYPRNVSRKEAHERPAPGPGAPEPARPRPHPDRGHRPGLHRLPHRLRQRPDGALRGPLPGRGLRARALCQPPVPRPRRLRAQRGHALRHRRPRGVPRPGRHRRGTPRHRPHHGGPLAASPHEGRRRVVVPPGLLGGGRRPCPQGRRRARGHGRRLGHQRPRHGLAQGPAQDRRDRAADRRGPRG